LFSKEKKIAKNLSQCCLFGDYFAQKKMTAHPPSKVAISVPLAIFSCTGSHDTHPFSPISLHDFASCANGDGFMYLSYLIFSLRAPHYCVFCAFGYYLLFGLQSFFLGSFLFSCQVFFLYLFIYFSPCIIAILNKTPLGLVAQPQVCLSPFVGLLSSQINNPSNLLTEVSSVFPSKWVCP
jgi:hypothetical protein